LVPVDPLVHVEPVERGSAGIVLDPCVGSGVEQDRYYISLKNDVFSKSVTRKSIFFRVLICRTY